MMQDENTTTPKTTGEADTAKQPQAKLPQARPLPKEVGGAKGPEPTRYGDWEHKGRCSDF